MDNKEQSPTGGDVSLVVSSRNTDRVHVEVRRGTSTNSVDVRVFSKDFAKQVSEAHEKRVAEHG